MPKRDSIPVTVIRDAIVRCETVSNPAVIEKETFTVHVRKLPAGEGKGWIVRVINKLDVALANYKQ